MKILILNTMISYGGGAGEMLAFVAETLVECNHEVTYLTYRNKTIERTLDPRIKHDHMQLENEGSNIRKAFISVLKLHKYIKQHKFDIAIAFLVPSQIRLVLSCLFLKTKVLLSQRGDPYYLEKNNMKNKIFKNIFDHIFSWGDFFVFQTEMAQKYYPLKVQKKSVIIPNPAKPLKRTVDRNKKTIENRIVTLSRLELKQKRQDVLIRAFKKFNKLYPNYILEIYGEGEDKEILENYIDEDPNIKLRGLTRDIVSAIQNAKIFVLTSDYEGIPNALIEAMSLGLPCISTDCSPGGAAFLIKNKINGVLVPRNNPEALYDAMCYMVEHPVEAEIMAKEAKKITSKLSCDRIAKLWLEAIQKTSET